MEKQKRNTRTKQMVMSILQEARSALCHEDIEKQLQEQIDRVTIYRILQGFCEDGKVHKIVCENGKTYYSLCHHCSAECHHDEHPHFHCLNCDAITCVEETLATQPLPAGYSVSHIVSLISGYCPDCSKLVTTFCLLAFFFIGHLSFAQNKITILDKETNEPVIFADIYYPDTKTGTHTDENGQFTINNTQSVLVQISAVGYKTFLENILIKERQTIYLQPSAHELQEVVVSEYGSRLQGENVMNVEKLSLKDATVQGVSLTDKLASVAGIGNLSTGAGIGKPVIRGLSGNRVAIFSQGVRIENQQWGDEHGLGLDENGYEQVEIIKGPASLLYGSDALGGVLFFADERYAKQNSLEGALNSEFNSNTNGWRNTGAFKLSKNRLHWNLFGGYTTHEDYKDGDNSAVPNSRFNVADVKTTLGYTGDRFITSLKYNYLHEKYGLTEKDDEDEDVSYKNGRTPLLPFQNLTTHLISSENTLFFGNGSKFKFDAGYIFNNRQELEDDAENAVLDMNLSTFSYNAKWFSPKWKERWALTAGSQGMYQTNMNHGEETLIPDAATADFGVFGVANYYYDEKAYWQTGVRFDVRRVFVETWRAASLRKTYPSFNFSTGIFQPLAKNLSFRSGLSSGFRAPNMFELLSDGVHEGTNRYEIGNADLKTENSYQLDASLNYRTKHLEIFLNPYFNYIRHFIYLQPAGDVVDGLPVYNYVQADAYLFGGEAGFHVHPHPLDWLHFDASYSNTTGEDVHHNCLPLMPSQKINATVSVSFTYKKCLKKLSVYLQNLYSFAQKRIADYETETPDYNLLSAGAAFEFALKRQKFQLEISANNLLNEVYFDHLSRYKVEGIYNMGRNFVFKVRVPLELGI